MDSLLPRAERLGLLLFVVSAACATTQRQADYRARPDLGARLSSTRTIGIVPPVMRIYQLGAGDTHELKEDWSAQACASVGQALVKALTPRGLTAKLIAPSAEADTSMQDVRLLYEAVGSAIRQTTYQNQFPGPTKAFEYSLGDVGGLLDQYGVDALLFTYGSDDISSAARSTTTAVSIAAAAVLGFGRIPLGGVSFLSLALVDRTGRVLWYDVMAQRGTYDLRNPVSAEEFVAVLVSELPRAKR